MNKDKIKCITCGKKTKALTLGNCVKCEREELKKRVKDLEHFVFEQHEFEYDFDNNGKCKVCGYIELAENEEGGFNN